MIIALVPPRIIRKEGEDVIFVPKKTTNIYSCFVSVFEATSTGFADYQNVQLCFGPLPIFRLAVLHYFASLLCAVQ